jgi:hypothetical protein
MILSFFLNSFSNLPRSSFQIDVMSLVLDTIGVFQSALVYTVDNVFLSRSITSIAFRPVRIGLEWKGIAVGRNIASNTAIDILELWAFNPGIIFLDDKTQNQADDHVSA